jgi:uncharacterized protein YcbK (DUF882 family)
MLGSFPSLIAPKLHRDYQSIQADFFRDHRTGDIMHYDPHVFDILSDLAAAVGHPDAEIDIICGYRVWVSRLLEH